MGLIGIRYGKVVHRPSCPAWAKIASVPKAASPSANRITAATDHRFTVFCPASSVRIRSSPRRVPPAPLPRTRHLLKLVEKLRRTKYTPHGHSASLLYSIFLGGVRTGERKNADLEMMSGQWERSILLSARSLLLSEEGTCSTRLFLQSYFASGLGRTWSLITLLVFPLPPSPWNGARVAYVVQMPFPFQPAPGLSMRPSIPFA